MTDTVTVATVATATNTDTESQPRPLYICCWDDEVQFNRYDETLNKLFISMKTGCEGPDAQLLFNPRKLTMTHVHRPLCDVKRTLANYGLHALDEFCMETPTDCVVFVVPYMGPRHHTIKLESVPAPVAQKPTGLALRDAFLPLAIGELHLYCEVGKKFRYDDNAMSALCWTFNERYPDQRDPQTCVRTKYSRSDSCLTLKPIGIISLNTITHVLYLYGLKVTGMPCTSEPDGDVLKLNIEAGAQRNCILPIVLIEYSQY